MTTSTPETQTAILEKLREISLVFKKAQNQLAFVCEKREEGLEAQIEIQFNCPFSHKRSRIRQTVMFQHPEGVDEWLGQLTNNRPYLTQKINRSTRYDAAN